MGNSTWSDKDWATTSQAYTKSATREALFSQRVVHTAFNPTNIAVRESVDSPANPHSTPIILGLDVTGSMGFLPEEIARRQLGPLITKIIDNKLIEDPHVMVMALGDIMYDRSPVQASQFEADIRIAEQLTQLYLEGGGGGNGWESYDLAWAFALFKTKTDSFAKRGKKGYIFTFGDEPPPPNSHVNTRSQLQALLGPVVERDYSTGELLSLVQEEWRVFHVIVEEGSFASSRPEQVRSAWGELLGPNVIRLNDYKLLPDVMAAVLKVAEGADAADVIMESIASTKAAIKHALTPIL